MSMSSVEDIVDTCFQSRIERYHARISIKPLGNIVCLCSAAKLEGIYTSAQSAQILSLENMDIGHLSPLRKTNGGISCFRHVCHLLRCFRGHWRGGRAGRQEFIFCGRALSIAQGSAPPECELVDTTFHALSTNGPGTATQSALPTS